MSGALRSDVRPWVHATTLGDALLRSAAETPDVDAVAFPDGERLTFAQLGARASQIASALIGLGVERHDRVGVLMPNSPDCVATLHGIFLAGASAVPINIRYRAREIPFVVRDGDVGVIVTSDRIDHYLELLTLLEAALPDLAAAGDPLNLRPEGAPCLRSVAVLGAGDRPWVVSEATLREVADGVASGTLAQRRAGVRVADEAILLYTSGTTSLPRGCPLTHEGLGRTWRSLGEILDVRPGDRFWSPCPLFHLASIGPMVTCVGLGATFLSDTYFEAERGLRLITDERATHLYPAYPPITQSLLDQPDFADADLSAARVMVNVGPPDTLAQMQAAAPGVIQLTQYGLTEAGGPVTYNRLTDDRDARLRTTGFPLPGVEVRVRDPLTGADAEIGRPGEILFRSPGMTNGYVNDPERSRAVFDADGWCHTGDRGAIDAAGRLAYLGRLKDMLKVGGENVAPAEVEDHLMTHPSVKLAQVVGIPDARLEEVPAAFVELRAGHAVTEDELLEFCTSSIARFKVPRLIRFVDDWPMSATKVQKGPLRELLIRELDSEAGGHRR